MKLNMKSKLVMLLTLSLVMSVTVFGTTKVSATSNPADAPDNWAFEASSVELNDAILLRYPQLNDGSGFITKTSANAQTGMLDVSNMNISGTINGIENFTNINQLYLSNNQFTGSIPVDIGDLNYLYVLDLNDNQLSGEIPTTVGNLDNLLQLYLSNNRFTGEVPASIGNLYNLKHLYLSNNQFTSIQQATYDSITSKQWFDVSNQESITNQTTPSPLATNYEFEGLPAFEQFTNYGVTFTYTLKLPNSTEKIINPSNVDGKVTIPASELTQIGNYSLVASGTSFDNRFTNFNYTTNFSLVDTAIDTVDYISATANGKKDKETTTKVSIDLSKVPVIGELTAADITLTPQAKTVISISKETLTSLGNGKYELMISGRWDEGAIIDVVLAKQDTIFTPSAQATILHTKAIVTDENNSNNNNNSNTNNKNSGKNNISTDKKKISTILHTGDSNSFIDVLILFAESLILCGYLIISKIEHK